MKKLVSAILAATLVLSTVTAGFTVLAADNPYSILTVQPLVSEDSLALTAKPTALIDSNVSTFSAYADYTVKTGQTASLLFDMPDTYTAKDINTSVPQELKVVDGAGSAYSNSDTWSMLKLQASNDIKFMQTEDIYTGRDFELSMYVGGGLGDYAVASIYMRNQELQLFICGNSSGNSIKLLNRTTGQEVTAASAKSKWLKVKAIGSKVEVLLTDGSTEDIYKPVISYEYPTGLAPQSGGISFTCNEQTAFFKDITIKAPRESTNYDSTADSYMQINLGETVSLSKRINGEEIFLASAKNPLTAGNTYAIRATREQGTVKVYADGTEILTYTDTFPLTDNGVSLWNGRIGVSATADDTLSNLKIYNSTHLKVNEEYAQLLAVQTGVSSRASIESSTENTGSIARNDDGSFAITALQTKGQYTKVKGFFDNAMSDIYFTFDISSNRPDYTAEALRFAGYKLTFGDSHSSDCSTVSPIVERYTGTDYKTLVATISCPDNYKYYYNDAHTLEFLKTGNTVSVWFYRKGEERQLLFTDSNCSVAANDFSVVKVQGTTTISNFTVYDQAPDGKVPNCGLNEYSEFTMTTDTIGNVPEGTSVRELIANLENPSQVSVKRDGTALVVTDKVQNGDKVVYEGRSLEWTVSTVANSEYMSRSIVGDALFEHCKLVGRQYYVENEGVNFEWNASNITLGGNMQGNVVAVINADIMPSADYYAETGFYVIVDGNTQNPKFITLEAGEHQYTVAENLTAGEHTVQILKNTESVKSVFLLEAIKFNGTPVKPKDKTLKIEFLGDSITAGCGINGETANDGLHFVYSNYASRTARMLGADYYCIANSGWGFESSLMGSITINSIYERVTSRRDPSMEWNFDNWQPDLVVINLGTNDNAKLSNKIKNTVDPDYAALKQSYQYYVEDLLDSVRMNNPNAYIIWTYGAMGYGIDVGDGLKSGDWIKEAVEAYPDPEGKTFFFKMDESMNGGGGHPDLIGSKYLAEDLTKFICEKTGWQASGLPEKVTYSDGQILADKTFDSTTDGLEAASQSALTLNDGKLRINSADNKRVMTSAVVGDRYLDTYEMTLDFKQLWNHDWNREIITLRSPNSSLSNAVYLAFLGDKVGPGNYLNHLNSTDNVQLISKVNNSIVKSQSVKLDDLYDGEKRVYVRMSKNLVEVTIYNVNEERPSEPTFSMSLEGSVAYGDIFFQAHCTTYEIDNLNVTYKTGSINRFEKAEAPVVSFRSQDKVSLAAKDGCEYSKDGINWYTSVDFTGLTAKETYTFYQRYAASGGKEPGYKSNPITVKLYLNGDISHDDAVNSSDLAMLKKHLLGTETVSDEFAADANTDRVIDILDLVRIKKLAAAQAS